jgi:hypothetical protein
VLLFQDPGRQRVGVVTVQHRYPGLDDHRSAVEVRRDEMDADAVFLDARIQRPITSRLISARLQRERGTPSMWGNSQASALTATTTLGGETALGARREVVLPSRRGVVRRSVCATC